MKRLIDNHMRMFFKSSLTLFMVSMISLVICDSTVIHVKPDKPYASNANQSCPEPCISLYINASQLSDLLTSNTILKLQPGIHFIGQDIITWNKTNVSFIGDVQNTEDVVHITCSENVSISFVNCSNVTIQDILFEHCGNFVDTSYLGTPIGENYWYRFPLIPKAALIFIHCFSTTLLNLFITESPGFGMVGVNMLGNTRVQSINVEFSGLFPCSTFYSSEGPLAGGMLLLFQNTPSGFPNSISTFTLSDSAFLSSCSPITIFGLSYYNFEDVADLAGSGGISAIFGQNMYSLNMVIENSTFANNIAYHHAGLNFIYYTGVSGAKVSINNCSFVDNIIDSSANSLQGVVAIDYATLIKSFYLKPGTSFQQLPSYLYIPNEVSITDCVFTNNTSSASSGISFLSSGEDYTMKVHLRNAHFTNNVGHTSSALMFLQRESPVFSTAFQVVIENCMFFNNSLIIPEDVYASDQVNLFRYASVVVFHNVRLTNFTGSALFDKNKGTSIFLYSSVISLNGTFEFIDNYATTGAGLGIYANSYVLVHEDTNISFVNNVARRRGGAVYVENLYSVPSNLANICFFQYLSSKGNLDDTGRIDVNVLFVNNSAGEAGNSIFSSLIDECSWLPNTAFQEISPSIITSRTISFADPLREQVSSEPYQVCFCSPSSTQNIETACIINSYSTTIYPGQTIDVGVVGTGQRYGPAPTIIYTTVSDESHCSINGKRQVVQEIPNHCTTLQYAIASNTSGVCNLEFRTDAAQPTLSFGSNEQRKAVINILDCPFGFVLNENGECDCHPLLTSRRNPARVSSCNVATQTFTRTSYSWFRTVNNSGNLTEIIAREYCSFGYCNSGNYYLSLNDTDSQCSYQRSGTLCGHCASSLSSVFGSSECEVCSNSWLFLIFVFAIAGIILVYIIFVLNLTITSGTINGIIFYANVISINANILFTTTYVFRPLSMFISLLNLDLGIETCFYNGMDEYAKVWLEFVFPIYLIAIVVVIIIMARYSTWAQRAVQSNGAPVLATLLFLSYTKLLRNASLGLFYIDSVIHLPSGKTEPVWALDANVEYFGFKFTILFIVLLLVFLLIVIPFTLVMLFTKTFLRLKHVAYFKPMLDAYQSPFADPFRFWLGFRLLIRAFLFSISALETVNVLLINSITLSGLAIMQGYFRPFKNFYCNLWDLLFLLNLATLFTVSQYFGESNAIIVIVLVGISFVKFVALICYHIMKAFGQQGKERMKKSKMYHKINIPLHRINTSLVTSSVYKHLAMIPQDAVQHSRSIRRSSDVVGYAEMREPLVILDDVN